MHVDLLVRAFERTVARAPQAPLVVSPTRLASAEAIDALARALLAGPLVPLRPGALVGLAVPDGPAFLAGLVALLRAGTRPVLLDVGTPGPERARVLERLGAAAALSASEAWPAGIDAFRCEACGGSAVAEGPAVVKLSSGSTGLPRGVLAPVEALLADVQAIHEGMGLTAADRYLATLPLSHSYGLASLAVPALERGATLVVPEARGPFEGLRAAEALGATILPTVPAWVQALLRVADRPALPRSIRLVLTAGAPLPPETAAAFRTAHRRAVHVFYGATECGGIAFDQEGTAGERGTVGRPLPGVAIRLRRQAGDPAGSQAIEVGSPAVAARYLPEPDDRLADGRFVTGDLGSWEGDELRLTGRADDLLKVRGKQVHPGEIERVLGALPGVEEVVALGLPGGERADPVLRVVVACPSGRLSREDVVAWCRARLAEHKVPRSVILLPALPRTDRGKVDRAALRAL